MLPHLLAQMDMPPPAVLASWVSVFMYLVGSIAAILGAVVAAKSLKTKPEPTQLEQPIQIKTAAEFATKPELHLLALKMDEELGRERGARKRIHEQIATIEAELAGLGKETTQQSADLTEMKKDIKIVSGLTSSTDGKVELMNQQLQQLNQHLLRKTS